VAGHEGAGRAPIAVSRGPGALQRAVLEVLDEEPGKRMWWPKIKQRFPVEVRSKNFYRAVRSLRRMGRVRLYDDGCLIYLGKERYYPRGGKTAVSEEDLAELLRSLPRRERDILVSEDRRQLEKWYVENTVEVVT
jgi:hypothetical protein